MCKQGGRRRRDARRQRRPAPPRAARTRDLRREYLFHYANYNILSGLQPPATNMICNLITCLIRVPITCLCFIRDFLKFLLFKALVDILKTVLGFYEQQLQLLQL